MNWERVAIELVRAARGSRTQQALSRALGYRANALFAWESGRDAPSARKFFLLLKTTGRPPLEVLARFGRGNAESCPTTREGMAQYLRSLVGNRTTHQLARQLERDRYAVGRWLRGTTDIPLGEFLRLIELCTLSPLDFIACAVDPQSVPSIASSYARVEAARLAAKQLPWSHAIVHMVDLPEYRELPKHVPGWFASRLGISINDEQRCLDVLIQMGRLRWEEGRLMGTEDLSVDMRADPDVTRKLASFWMAQGAERVLTPGEGRFAFNAFGVSRTDFERLKALQSRYFAELRSIVAASERAELVAVATFQLFPLAGDELPPQR